jgi:exosortase/archaeosortase family protein
MASSATVRHDASIRLPGLALLAIIVQHHRALGWLGRTWVEDSYQSWGFVPLLLVLLPVLLRLPARRPRPSRRHLAGLVALALLDLLTAPLGLNIVGAILALTSLQLWLFAFRRYPGHWLAQRQLWLALLCLPLVHWGNAFFGFSLQRAVSRAAGLFLTLYGHRGRVDGTLLHCDGTVIAVDTACSGLKLLYAGTIFGLLALPRGLARSRQLLYWAGLFILLLACNLTRVLCLALVHLQRGGISETLHQTIGLVAFALVCALTLLWARRLTPPLPCPARPRGAR